MIIGRETKKLENNPTIGSAFCFVFIIQYIDHKTVDSKANKTPSILEKFKILFDTLMSFKFIFVLVILMLILKYVKKYVNYN